jgi:hypothetical protein
MEEGGDGRIRKCGDERTQRLSGFQKIVSGIFLVHDDGAFTKISY